MYVRWKTRIPRSLQTSIFGSFNHRSIYHTFLELAQYEYAYLVESYRDANGKARQRDIAYLGTVSKPLSLCERTNHVLDNLPGLGKRQRLKILKSISHRCRTIRIEDERLSFDLP